MAPEKPRRPVIVRDVTGPKLPVALKSGRVLAAIKPMARSAPVSLSRRPAAVLPRKPAAIVQPRLALKITHQKSAPSVRKSPVVPAASSALPSKAKTSSVKKTLALHEAKTQKPHSEIPRDAGLSICKERPKSTSPSSKGGGGSRAFVPWCR